MQNYLNFKISFLIRNRFILTLAEIDEAIYINIFLFYVMTSCIRTLYILYLVMVLLLDIPLHT